MNKGFFYKKGTEERIPYWVDENQASEFAARHGGTKENFRMALKGYGIMEPVAWEFRQTDTKGYEQWNTEG